MGTLGFIALPRRSPSSERLTRGEAEHLTAKLRRAEVDMRYWFEDAATANFIVEANNWVVYELAK